jgi:hypothetical protein
MKAVVFGLILAALLGPVGTAAANENGLKVHADRFAPNQKLCSTDINWLNTWWEKW